MQDVSLETAAGETRFRQLLEKVEDGVLVVRLDGTIVYANPAAGKMLGRRVTDLIGAMLGQPVVPGETTEIDLFLGRTGQGATRSLSPPRVAELRASQVEWQGRPAFLATLRDTTEHRRTGNTLRFLSEASNRLAGSLDRTTTLETVADLAAEHLADWCLIDLVEGDLRLNPEAKLHRQAYYRSDPTRQSLADQLAGQFPLGSGEVAGISRAIRMGWLEVYHNISHSEISTLTLDVAQEPIFRQLGCHSALIAPMNARGHCLGAITFVSATPWRSYDQAEQALAQDLADRAALALDNARLYDAAQDALRRRDEFLAILAHELRNPLAPILSAVQLMRLEGMGNDNLERQRAIIERQSYHLSRLLDDLLDLSRVTYGQIELRLQVIDLGMVITDALQVTRGLMEGRRHHLTIEMSSSPLILEGDPTRLAQVLGNLLTNAARYTEPGGRIHLRALRQGDEAVVQISDTGRGIPAEMLQRIFEPFTQVNPTIDRAGGGMGIGLSLVRRLVELHRGSIKASSPGPGQGSTFEVRLPLSARILAPSEPPRTEITPRRILLIEDNVDGREMLAELLRFWGHQVIGVGDGSTGLAQIAVNPPDAALIDIGLPELDGYRLARQIRQLPRGNDILLLAVTGYGQPDDRLRALEAGFDEHLIKPVDLNYLSELLERGRVRS